MANGLLHLFALQNIYGESFRWNSRNDGLRNLTDRIFVHRGSWNPVLSASRGTFLGISSRVRSRELVNDDPILGILMAKVFMKGLVSAVGVTAEAPFQRVKLLLQNERELIKSSRLSAPFIGITDCFARIIKNEGFISLWRGNSVNLIRIFPDQILKGVLGFGFHKVVPYSRRDKDGYQMLFLRNLVAGVGSYTCLYSLDYAQTRLASDIKCVKRRGGERQFNGLFDVYKKTLKSEGVSGIYRGFNIGFVGVIFKCVYHLAYVSAPKPDPSKKPSLLSSLPLGAFLLVSYPFDTVQRRMMMTSGETFKYKSSMDAFSQIIKNEGIVSFYKGLGAQILGHIPTYFVLAGYLMMERRSGKPFGGISVVIETK